MPVINFPADETANNIQIVIGIIAFVALFVSFLSYRVSSNAYLVATLPTVTSKLEFENAGQPSYENNNEHVTRLTRITSTVVNHSPDINLVDLTMRVTVTVKRGFFSRVRQELSYCENDLLSEKDNWPHVLDYKHPYRRSRDEVLEIMLAEKEYGILQPVMSENKHVELYEVLRDEWVLISQIVTYVPAVNNGKVRKIEKHYKLKPLTREYQPGKYVLIGWSSSLIRGNFIQRRLR